MSGKKKYIKDRFGRFAGSVPSTGSVPKSPSIPPRGLSSSSNADSDAPLDVSSIRNSFALHTLAKETDSYEVKSQIVANPNASEYSLTYLVNRNSDAQLRSAIISHPNCSDKVISAWSKQASRDELATLLTPGHPNYEKASSELISQAVAPNVHSSRSETLMRLAAQHPNTKPDTLRFIARNYPVALSSELLSNKNLPEDAKQSILRTTRNMMN